MRCLADFILDSDLCLPTGSPPPAPNATGCGGCTWAAWRRFDRGWLSVDQMVALNPLAGGPAARPWTRNSRYRPEMAAPTGGDVSAA